MDIIDQMPTTIVAPRPRRAKRLSGDERRRQLLAVAERIVKRGGAGSLTMERVAEQSKVTIPIVYRHFSNRSALLLALLEEYWQDFDRRLQLELDKVDDLDGFIRSATRAYFDSVEARGSVFLTLLTERTAIGEFEDRRRARRLQLVRAWANHLERYCGLEAAVAEAASSMISAAGTTAAEHWILHPQLPRTVVESLQISLASSFLHALTTANTALAGSPIRAGRRRKS